MREDLAKLAFLGGAMAAAKNLMPAARRVIPVAAGNIASAIKGTVPGASRGMGEAIRSDVKWGAGIGGLLDGGVAAASADPGERGDAFMRGAARGAALGAASGVASGAARQGMRNMRQNHLTNMADAQMRAQRIDPMARLTYAPVQGEQALNNRWLSDIGQVVTGKGALGRKGSAFEALAAPATIVGDAAIGGLAYEAADKLLPGGQPAPPQGPLFPEMPQKQAAAETTQLPSYEEAKPTLPQISLPPIAGSLAGGFIGNRGTDLLLGKLEEAGRLAPALKGKWARGTAPAAAGALSAGLGYGAVKAMQPEELPPPELEALKGINLEALKRRYPAMPAQ